MHLQLSAIALYVAVAAATVTDIPGIVPPIYPILPNSPVDVSQFLKSRPSDFVHPGIWHTHDDLERIRLGVVNDIEPWKSAYANFSQDSYSSADYEMQGPATVLSRGSVSNYSTFTNDVRAAWQNAMMWYITRDQAHWNRSTTILDAWGSKLTDITGTDRSLLIGLEGDLFVNAAEIMRWEGNWTEAGASYKGGSGFSVQLYWLFSRQSAVIGQANYGMVSIKALLSFAIYLDDVTLYNYAINEYVNNQCAGVLHSYEENTGQSIETGRDQGHAQSGIGWSALGARVGQSQGADLFGIENNRLLKASEYTAAVNLNGTVTYDPSWFRCEAVLVGGPWSALSYESFGIGSYNKYLWDLLYYTYVVKKGLSGPWTVEARTAEGFEGHTTSAEFPSWGDLIWS